MLYCSIWLRSKNGKTLISMLAAWMMFASAASLTAAPHYWRIHLGVLLGMVGIVVVAMACIFTCAHFCNAKRLTMQRSRSARISPCVSGTHLDVG